MEVMMIAAELTKEFCFLNENEMREILKVSSQKWKKQWMQLPLERKFLLTAEEESFAAVSEYFHELNEQYLPADDSSSQPNVVNDRERFFRQSHLCTVGGE
jgi:hypothetical protein